MNVMNEVEIANWDPFCVFLEFHGIATNDDSRSVLAGRDDTGVIEYERLQVCDQRKTREKTR